MTSQPDPWDAGDAKRLRRTEALQEGIFCEYVCEVLQAMPIQNGKSRVLVVTDYTEHPDLPYYNIHKATTPQGKRSVRVTLWDDHAYLSADLDVRAGHFLLLKNVVPKYQRQTKTIEVAMHGTRSYQRFKPQRSVVILDDYHNLVKEILNRKALYEQSLQGDAFQGYTIAPVEERSAPPESLTTPSVTTAKALLASRQSETATTLSPMSSFAAPIYLSQAVEASQDVAIQQSPRSPGVVLRTQTFTVPSAPMTSEDSQESVTEYISHPGTVTPEIKRRESSGISTPLLPPKRESLSPMTFFNNASSTNRDNNGIGGGNNQRLLREQQQLPHVQRQGTNDPQVLEMAPIPTQTPSRVFEKPRHLNKIRIRGRIQDWYPSQIKQFLHCRCSACSSTISPITAKPVCPQRALGCRGEPQMRYEFSMLVVDEFNQPLTVQVPSNIAAVRMGMTDPCNWESKNKQSRYEEACQALAKYGIYDRSPSSGPGYNNSNNNNKNKTANIELDLVVSLARPSLHQQHATSAPAPDLPIIPDQDLNNNHVETAAPPSSAPIQHHQLDNHYSSGALSSADQIAWSSTKRRLFTNESAGAIEGWKKPRTVSVPPSVSLSSPSSSSSSSGLAPFLSSTSPAPEYTMELVSINVVPPIAAVASQQQYGQHPQRRHPSVQPHSRESTPRHQTPKPPERRR